MAQDVRSTIARGGLVAAVAVCLATWLVGVRLPYFDYDDATQGIFVNDVSFRADLDASFEGRPDRQDVYRTAFAAQRLAFTLPLSWVQRGLQLPPWEVEGLLRVAALVFAVAGSWLAALSLLPRPEGPAGERFVLLAALVAHPSLALFARSGAAFYVFAYALFWLGTLATSRWLAGGKTVWVYVAGATAAACLLNPYPPLLCWPAAGAALAAWDGRAGARARSPHLYGAAALAVALAALATLGMARAYDTSFGSFLARQAAFRADRGSAVALSQLLTINPVDKLVKLLDQQVLSRVDSLGDVSRDDSIWVLGALQPAVVPWALAAVYGLWIALRARAVEDRRALAVAGVLILLFFTVSFPEGRYALALLPCWGYFALRGVAAVARGDLARRVTLAVGLLMLGAGTEHRIRHAYVPRSLRAWTFFEGMQAAAPLVAALPDGGRGTGVFMPYPLRDMPELRFRMVMPAGATWLPRTRAGESTARPGPGAPMAALAYADEPAWVDYLVARGFTRRAELKGEASGRTMLFLVRAPAP
jgi:hypothetical protein